MRPDAAARRARDRRPRSTGVHLLGSRPGRRRQWPVLRARSRRAMAAHARNPRPQRAQREPEPRQDVRRRRERPLRRRRAQRPVPLRERQEVQELPREESPSSMVESHADTAQRISPSASPRWSATCRSRHKRARRARPAGTPRPPRASGTTPQAAQAPHAASDLAARRRHQGVSTRRSRLLERGAERRRARLEADDEETVRLRRRVRRAARGHARRARALELVHRASSTTATPS